MGDVIAVTGASGNVGRQVASRLLSSGRNVRAIARGKEKLADLAARGAELRIGSLGDRSFLAEALRGASAVFAMVPPQYAAADPLAEQRAIAESLVGAIRDAGVEHVVALSSVGAELPEGTGPIATLHHLEGLLDGLAGSSRVYVRAAYFMENHLGSIGLIKAAGIIASSIKGDAPISMVATRDISSAAADRLAAVGPPGRLVQYVLGPRDYSMAEATRILGAAVGRPDLKYVEAPEEDARKGLVGAGFSPGTADLFLQMNRGLGSGRIKGEPRSTSNTTPTTLEEFARTVFAPAFGG
jgi:uncharacterized protein YbjT (DUF2867 family)